MRRVLFLTAVFALAAIAAARPKAHELDGYTFDKYVRDFSKRYEVGSEEYLKRRAVFDASLKTVQEHNAKGLLWKKGVNHMSDWTDAEKARLRGNKVGMKKRLEEKGIRAERVHQVSGAPLPKYVDWRNAKPAVVSAVKDQGHCGSCWAHAATESIESHVAISTGELYVLSQQQITSCTQDPNECGGTGGCNGAIAELAFDYVKNNGLQQEWVEPYTSYFGDSGTCPTSIKYPVVNISGYTSVAHNDADAAADALAHAGPLAISVDASEWSDYESGVYHGCSYAKNISMDHAVQAVGYGHDDSLGVDYWLVRNSWSPAWGEQGYIRLLRQPGNTQCGWNVDPANGDGCKGQTAPEWACGMCGIAYDTLYPNFAKNN